MSDKRGDLEKRLREQAEQVISQMLDAKAGRGDLSISEMEDLVGMMETNFRQSVMQALVEESQAKDNGQCPSVRATCGTREKRENGSLPCVEKLRLSGITMCV